MLPKLGFAAVSWVGDGFNLPIWGKLIPRNRCPVNFKTYFEGAKKSLTVICAPEAIADGNI